MMKIRFSDFAMQSFLYAFTIINNTAYLVAYDFTSVLFSQSLNTILIRIRIVELGVGEFYTVSALRRVGVDNQIIE